MNVESLKKILKNCTEENICCNEPHISLRCSENATTKESIVHVMLKETNRLINVIQARADVYKVYFQLSKRRQLKVVIDFIQPRKIMIRTIKILDRKLYKNIKRIKRRRW